MTSQPARREQSRDQRDFLEIYTALERYDRLGLSSFVRTVSLFSCGICCNELPSAEAVSLPTSCHHGPVCRSCLANHLEGQIFAHRRGLVSEHHPTKFTICYDRWDIFCDSRRKKRAA